MGSKTLIAWTDHTWNPWMGCRKVSAGCKHCYAETLTRNRMGIEVFGSEGLRRRTSQKVWARPISWNDTASKERRPHRVFCASLADIFEDAPGPNDWRADVFDVIRRTPWLDYQLLTKRPENFPRMLPDDWPLPNVWLGTSIEDNRVAHRAADLIAVPATVHFVSYEPAIGPLDELELDDIEWMIVGGESGPGYRKMDIDWAYEMRARCDDAGIAFFFKQNHGHRTEMGIDALGEVVRHYPPTWNRDQELPIGDPSWSGAGRRGAQGALL